MSLRPCEVLDSVAMLPSSLASEFGPISEGFAPAEGCDLQSSPVSLQALRVILLRGPVNSNTQTRTTVTQHDLTVPAACTHNHELSYTEEEEQEKNPPLCSELQFNVPAPHSLNSPFSVVSLNNALFSRSNMMLLQVWHHAKNKRLSLFCNSKPLFIM